MPGNGIASLRIHLNYAEVSEATGKHAYVLGLITLRLPLELATTPLIYSSVESNWLAFESIIRTNHEHCSMRSTSYLLRHQRSKAFILG